MVSIARTIAIATSSDADHERADAVPDAVAGDQRQADAEEREDQADQGGEVLQQDDRQLGGLGAADELRPSDVLPRIWLDSWIAVRNEKHSSTIATTQHDDRTHCQASMRLAGAATCGTPS